MVGSAGCLQLDAADADLLLGGHGVRAAEYVGQSRVPGNTERGCVRNELSHAAQYFEEVRRAATQGGERLTCGVPSARGWEGKARAGQGRLVGKTR